MQAHQAKYPQIVNAEELQELISRSDLLLLVVFFSPVCGPSHLIESVLADVSVKMQSKVKIVKIDSEAYSNLASHYQVHPLPTLLVFQDGKLIGKIEEEESKKLMSSANLIQRLQPFMKNHSVAD
ncbi:thioredoxin family protein [Anabaena sp. CA = ATCC 33047]|uniref:thioredoxin family protein n=1 Tax=Anabaena sp. (strain CA / ATCC 33047) TaxID=52271 RepID=UPI00083277DB|nr:thioredoxin family protein [Anabaena sp. CA = ATCC 33047]